MGRGLTGYSALRLCYNYPYGYMSLVVYYCSYIIT